jgi:hypothetical protein
VPKWHGSTNSKLSLVRSAALQRANVSGIKGQWLDRGVSMMSSDFRLRWIVSSLALATLWVPCSYATSDEVEAGAVKLKRAIAVRVAPDKSALSIDYEYRFVGRQVIHIEGLGEVPAEGSFKYITEANTLVFSDASSGTTLASVKLKETVAVAAKPPLNKVPADEDFDKSIRVFRWSSDRSFQARAGAAIGKYVSYEPREMGGITEFATTFAPIEATTGDSNVPGRVAMLFSFPYDKDPTGFSVHVRILAQEGRPKSDEYRNSGDPAILKSANEFVDKIVGDLGLQR